MPSSSTTARHLPTNVNVDALTDVGAITFDSVTSDGKADVLHWTYHPDSADLDFLEPGDTLTITYQAEVSDGHGTSAAAADRHARRQWRVDRQSAPRRTTPSTMSAAA